MQICMLSLPQTWALVGPSELRVSAPHNSGYVAAAQPKRIAAINITYRKACLRSAVEIFVVSAPSKSGSTVKHSSGKFEFC
jgi:hypothetical protein